MTNKTKRNETLTNLIVVIVVSFAFLTLIACQRELKTNTSGKVSYNNNCSVYEICK